jgi:hypothetical protein
MYIIQEIQTNNSQTALLPALVYSNQDEAESAYHMKLGSAAISNIDIHTVIIYDEYGNIIKREYYNHYK